MTTDLKYDRVTFKKGSSNTIIFRVFSYNTYSSLPGPAVTSSRLYQFELKLSEKFHSVGKRTKKLFFLADLVLTGWSVVTMGLTN